MLNLYAQMEYLRGALDTSDEVLRFPQKMDNRSYSDSGISAPFILHNNMACLHQKMGKYNLGSFFFREALLEYEKVCSKYCLESILIEVCR